MTPNPPTMGEVPTLEMSDTLQTVDSAKSHMNQPLSQTSNIRCVCVAVTLLACFREINSSDFTHATIQPEQKYSGIGMAGRLQAIVALPSVKETPVRTI
jgi:hypothetical protein